MIDIDELIKDYEKKAKRHQNMSDSGKDYRMNDHRQKAERFALVAKALAFFKRGEKHDD